MTAILKRTQLLVALSGLWLTTIVAAGCADVGNCRRGSLAATTDQFCAGSPPCFGFTSTCWRPWPEECPPCPPYTLTEQQPETLTQKLFGFHYLPSFDTLPENGAEALQLSYARPLPKARITKLVPATTTVQ